MITSSPSSTWPWIDMYNASYAPDVTSTSLNGSTWRPINFEYSVDNAFTSLGCPWWREKFQASSDRYLWTISERYKFHLRNLECIDGACDSGYLRWPPTRQWCISEQDSQKNLLPTPTAYTAEPNRHTHSCTKVTQKQLRNMIFNHEIKLEMYQTLGALPWYRFGSWNFLAIDFSIDIMRRCKSDVDAACRYIPNKLNAVLLRRAWTPLKNTWSRNWIPADKATSPTR